MKFAKNAGLIALGLGAGLLGSHLLQPAGKAQFEDAPSLETTLSQQAPPSSRDMSAPGAGITVQRQMLLMPAQESTPAQQQANARATQLKLDGRLRSEVINQKWAMEQEEAILAAISGDPNDGFPAALPGSVDTQCRSTLCKVTMTFADEEDAVQMQTKLTLGLRGAIATARSFYAPRPDGRVDLVVYAGNAANLQ